MKNQDLFSLKNKSKKLKCHLLRAFFFWRVFSKLIEVVVLLFLRPR